MKRTATFIKGKFGLLLAVIVATAVGGVTTAVVLASIPDSNGVIHGCRDTSKGNLRVIDSDAGQVCTNKETALNWNQSSSSSGSGIVLYDGNNQALGEPIAATAVPGGNGGPYTMAVFNHTINRIIGIQEIYSSVNQTRTFVAGGLTDPVYTTTDCTGQSYFPYNNTYKDSENGWKTYLWRWTNVGAQSPTYAIVADNASLVANLTVNSQLWEDGCHNASNDTSYPYNVQTAFPLTTISLPFTLPLTTPYHF